VVVLKLFSEAGSGKRVLLPAAAIETPDAKRLWQ